MNPSVDLRSIVKAKIHPSIGIARVGSGQSDAFLAPEVNDAPPLRESEYRDRTGAIRRHAVRFRVYGYSDDDTPVVELTAANAGITWSVHVANAKSAWYGVGPVPLDLDKAENCPLRSQAFLVTDELRQSAVIDSGPRVIAGQNQRGPKLQGFFLSKPVSLGELQTDEAGRLIFVGGSGVSGKVDSTGPSFDDTCDGPVSATVVVDGKSVPCISAWVVSAPPNYAPGLQSVRTMYDLAYQAAIKGELIKAPADLGPVSFSKHVLPPLRRMCDLGWVNRNFFAVFGWGKAKHWMAPDTLKALSTAPESVASPEKQAELARLRRDVLDTFRDPGSSVLDLSKWPRLIGDVLGDPPDARRVLAICPFQWDNLHKWAEGAFIADFDPAASVPASLECLPVAEQPAMLDRVHLNSCIADCFHPGIELGWPMRVPSLYSEPFRIRVGLPISAKQIFFGQELSRETALSAEGPLQAQQPGGLTRWLRTPWIEDLNGCGEEPIGNAGKFPFWPARAPNHVISFETYQSMLRTGSAALLAKREDWQPDAVPLRSRLVLPRSSNGVAGLPPTILVAHQSPLPGRE